MGSVLLAVDASTPDLTFDDRLLADALERRDVAARPVRWGTPVPAGAVVVMRSAWDYVDRPAQFLAWLDHLDEHGVTVVNPTSLLRWNIHKRYLLDLDQRGVRIVPTELVGRGDHRSLEQVRAGRGWSDVVVKPAIGGTARETVHSGSVGQGGAATHLARIIEREDALVQPVIDSVRTRGEVSVITLGGTPTAAILKLPTPGEWRVQSDFGGTARQIELTDDLVAIARRSVDTMLDPTMLDPTMLDPTMLDPTMPDPPIYARVDVVLLDGAWAVMELELVEPELYFRLDSTLAESFADLLVPLVA